MPNKEEKKFIFGGAAVGAVLGCVFFIWPFKALSPIADPIVEIANPVVEEAIRKAAKKPTGELTKADLEKVWYLDLHNNQLTDVEGLEKLTQATRLDLSENQLTDVKGLEKLTQLRYLNLQDNPDLTKAQVDELQKALPQCGISSNAHAHGIGLEF